MPKADYVTQQQFGEGIKELKTFILESEERVLGELKNMREEHDTHQYSHARINDELHEHKDRLKAIESSDN